jgi:hypothetical protein
MVTDIMVSWCLLFHGVCVCGDVIGSLVEVVEVALSSTIAITILCRAAIRPSSPVL